MATNAPKGDGRRNGALKKRTQLQANDKSWTKRDAETGKFLDHKADPKFKGIRKEK